MKDPTTPSWQVVPPSSPDEGAGTRSPLPDHGPASYEGLVEPHDFLIARPTWRSYVFAIALTAVAIGLRLWVDNFGAEIVPFALFYPVVLVCTLFGGIGPGAVSLALSAAAAAYLWLAPVGSFATTTPDLISFVLFVLSNAANIYVAHRLRTAHDRLRRSEARLTLSQDVGRIGIWDLDLKTGALWWSPSFYKVTGISADEEPSVEAVIERIDDADRDRARAAFEVARRGLDRLDIEFRFNRDDGSAIWLAGRAELFRDAQGRPSRLLGINFDATHTRAAETERDRANSLLATFFDNMPGAAFAKDLEGRYLLGNPVFATAIGQAPKAFLGKNDLELLIDKEQARVIMANDQAVIAGGAARHLVEDLRLPNGEMSHWLSVKAPFVDAAGRPQGIMCISLDVTDRRKAEDRLRFLADEVDHRAKNLLGVVLSLVRLTKVDDVAAFKAAVTGRIEALARAHTLLAANRWQGVDIATLLKEEIAPFGRVGSERIRLEGPPLMLEPGAAQALAMAVHELAINAAMHGALSVEEGRLDVAWEVIEDVDDGRLALVWQEREGPPVAAPAKPGFGSTAIRGAIEHQLGGSFDLDWAPAGVTCRVAFPLARNRAAEQPAVARGAGERAHESGPTPPVPLAGKRVLILEDEALIALTLMDAVRELGCSVIGPASNVGAALELVRQNPPELAILDVNLAGIGSAPVAEALHARHVPFVYCTGYAEPALQIDPVLSAPMLTKPIDTRALADALRAAVAAAETATRSAPVEAGITEA